MPWRFVNGRRLGWVLVAEFTPPSRMSLNAKLKNQAAAAGRNVLLERRRFVYERLLARLDATDPLRWMVKGGRAIEYRMEGESRPTKDVDLSFLLSPDEDRGVLQERLEAACANDLGDGFDFSLVGIAESHTDLLGSPGYSIRLRADYLGEAFEQVPVDASVDRVFSIPPDITSTSGMLGFPSARVALVSVEQQIAEKVHAMTRIYGVGHVSTRPHDLVDIVALLRHREVDSSLLGRAAEEIFGVRRTHGLPRELPAPPPEWADAFSRYGAAYGLQGLTFSQGVTEVAAAWRTAMATLGPAAPARPGLE